MSKRKRVLLVNSMLHPVGIQVLEREVDVIERPTFGSEGLADVVPNVHGILVRSPGKVTREVLEAGPMVEVVGAPGAGLNSLDLVAATELQIPVVHCPGIGATAVSEHAIGLMIAAARKFHLIDRELRSEVKWNERTASYKGTELEGKVLGLVGLGNIGRQVAKKCQLAFHMTVVAYDPYVRSEDAAELGVSMVDDLCEMVSRADFVSIHTPITDETRGLFDRRAIRSMKPSAYVINTSRGAIIVEQDLVDALSEGRIAGAGLDVFAHEPPAANHPYFSLDNVILTAHCAGITLETSAITSRTIAEQILQVLRGERPPHLANPEIWDDFVARRHRKTS